MKIYLTCDMEGIATTCSFDDGLPAFPQYPLHCAQLTREVVAACEGAIAAGATEIVINDAHNTGTNLEPVELPACCRIIRGWSGHPYLMVEGLDASFDAVMFVGYHSGASATGNPLAHTLSLKFRTVKLNGAFLNEFMLFSLCARREGVPVVYLSGDRQLCEQQQAVMPGLVTTAVKEGFGATSIAWSPAGAIQRIRQDAERALKQDLASACPPLPERFELEVEFLHAHDAYKCRFYPGVRPAGDTMLCFTHSDLFEVMCFFNHIILIQ